MPSLRFHRNHGWFGLAQNADFGDRLADCGQSMRPWLGLRAAARG